MENEEMREIMTERREIYDGAVVHLTRDTVRIPGGGESVREVVWHRGAVCVAPITAAGEIVLVEQYRYAMGTVLLEIPAGKLEKGDTDRLAAAKRELEEETGLRAATMVDFGMYYGSPAILSERISMYLALDLETGEAHPDADEFLRVRRIPLKDAARMVLRGEIPDGKTQAAILRAKAWLEENR